MRCLYKEGMKIKMKFNSTRFLIRNYYYNENYMRENSREGK